MFVEDVNGDLINLERIDSVICYRTTIEINREGQYIQIFESDNPQDCKEYMSELKKELAAFGKLIRVEMD